MVNLYADVFSPYYRIRGNFNKFMKLKREYFRLVEDIKEQSNADVDNMSDEEFEAASKKFESTCDARDKAWKALIFSQIKTIRPNDWMKEFLKSFKAEDYLDWKEISPKRYEVFSQNSELIDVRDTTACFKYNGYIYYTCILGMGHHYLKIIAES